MLRRIVEARLAFLVSGGTGSGKTTLLGGAARAGARTTSGSSSWRTPASWLPTIRTSCGWRAGRPTPSSPGAITLTDLVRQSLRMRPDRLVVGEVRGAEICDLLTAMNTGHEGGCGTVHANSAADVPARLEALAALGGLGRAALHAQLASALHAVVHVRRDDRGRRRVGEIAVFVRDRASGLVRTERAVQFTADGRTVLGPGSGRLETAARPMMLADSA